MPLDPNIILGAQAPQIANPLDMAQKVLTMKQLAQHAQLQDQEIAANTAVKDAYNQNTSVDPDGKPVLNPTGAMSSLMQKGYGRQALEMKQTLQAQDQSTAEAQMKILKDRHEQAADIAWSVPTDPNTPIEQKQAAWTQAKQRATQAGLPGADQSPDQYPGDAFVKGMQMHTLTAKEQSDAIWKQKEFEQKQADLQVRRGEANQYKVNNLAQAMGKDLDPDAARAGNFGQVSARKLSAERLQTLVGSYKDGNLPPAQMEEMALGLSNMLAPGGGGSREQVSALVPHSVMGDVQKTKQWLLNEPMGANQQAFVQQMMHTVDREAQLADSQMKTIQISRLSKHSLLQKLAPDQYQAMLQSKGIDPTMIKNGKYVPPPVADAHPQDEQALQWAKANPNDPRSATILKANGAQ